MGVLVPPSLFGFPAFKSGMRYRKKAGDTPEPTPSKPKEEKPKVPPKVPPQEAPERQYAKIVPANYDPATDPDYQDDELRQRMQEAIDRSNRKPTQQFAGRTAEDYPTLSEEQRVSRERRPVSFSD